MTLSPSEAMHIDLLQALKNNEFILYYQPQYNLIDGTFDSVEALLRWQHVSKGVLLPATFLPFAEENGLIILIGEWVLREACRQNKEWQDKKLSPIRVAVNVASRQFQHKGLVETIKTILEETKLEPHYLEIELAENLILDDEEKIVRQIYKLKDLGVSIALDDFGTGYSSISYLKKIPLDRIKIDRSYISGIPNSREDAAIVRAIIQLAAGLRLSVVAEGVENLMQLQSLMKYRCKEVQGYYFSEPLPALEVEKFLVLKS